LLCVCENSSAQEKFDLQNDLPKDANVFFLPEKQWKNDQPENWVKVHVRKGQTVKVTLDSIGKYKVKIETPPKTFTHVGALSVKELRRFTVSDGSAVSMVEVAMTEMRGKGLFDVRGLYAIVPIDKDEAVKAQLKAMQGEWRVTWEVDGKVVDNNSIKMTVEKDKVKTEGTLERKGRILTVMPWVYPNAMDIDLGAGEKTMAIYQIYGQLLDAEVTIAYYTDNPMRRPTGFSSHKGLTVLKLTRSNANE